jgi:hypothetical protein
LREPTLQLGSGSEIEFDVDAAERRIGISGWKFARSQEIDVASGNEAGLRAGFARPDLTMRGDAGDDPQRRFRAAHRLCVVRRR